MQEIMMNNEMVNIKEGHVQKDDIKLQMKHIMSSQKKNRIKCDVQHSANPSSAGQLRNSQTVHYVQGSHLMGRSCTPDLNSPRVRSHDRHLTKSPVDHDDIFWISVDVS